MDRGLYIASSGMLAELAREDQIANDLANASTPGYKSETSTQHPFGEMLLANSTTGQTIGTLGLGAQIGATTVDLTPQPLEQTGQPLDLGLQGDGFFVVQTTAGRSYTRDGQFELDAQGRLETASGDLVLSTAGRPITVGSSDGVTISSNGTVSRGGQPIATLAVVSLSNVSEQGNTLFSGTPGARPTGTTVQQGELENSGVNATTAMVDMLTSLREYQSDQQAVQTINESLGEGIQAGGL